MGGFGRKAMIRILLGILVAGVFFTGCDDKKQKDYGTMTGEEEFKADPKDLKETTLTFYFEAQENKNSREVLDEIEKQVKDTLKVKLNFKYIWEYPEGYLRQLKALISSGEACDAFMYHEDIPGRLKGLVDEKIAMDLTGIFPKYAPGYYKQFSKEELRAATVDGKLAAIPNKLPYSDRRCAFVREDLMKKYGIKDIQSYEDLENFMAKVKENDSTMIPTIFYETSIGLFAEASGYALLDYEEGLVYRWEDPKMKLLAWEQTPEFRQSITRLNEWSKKGYLLKNIGASQIDESIITSGKWASIIAPMSNGVEFNAMVKAKSNVDWKYKPCSLYPGKISGRASPVSGAMVVNAKSQNAERVLMFVNWLQSKQSNYDLLMYGIKGKHYNLSGEQIAIPSGTRLNETYLTWGGRFVFSNFEYERTHVGESQDLKKWYQKEIQSSTKYPTHLGFIPDFSSVNEIAGFRRMTFYQIEQKIYTESFKPEDLDTYIKDRQNEGVEKFVSAIQDQLDRWKAEQK